MKRYLSTIIGIWRLLFNGQVIVSRTIADKPKHWHWKWTPN